jgi:hypothetical protein
MMDYDDQVPHGQWNIEAPYSIFIINHSESLWSQRKSVPYPTATSMERETDMSRRGEDTRQGNFSSKLNCEVEIHLDAQIRHIDGVSALSTGIGAAAGE